MSEHVLAILVKAIGASQAAKDLKGVDKAVAGIGLRTGRGLRTFGSNLKSAFTTPIGLLGITGGMFALDKVLSDSVGKAQDFGSEVSKLMALTGQSAETVSALAAGMEHFGIASDVAIRSVGMLEKNVGNLTTANAKGQQQVANWNKTHKVAISQQQRLALLYPKAVKFQQQYGLSILNNNGTVKNANDLLLTSADYFNNKSIPAQTKAAALAKIYGRSWQQDLIPYLKAGSKGISEAEAEAKRLGLTLSGANIDALKKNRDATREWNTALGGLELQIGLKLIPYMTTLAQTATTFVEQHGSDITGFFDDAAKFAGELGGAIHDYVVPAFNAISDVWGKIPPDLKKLLIAGFVANKLSGGALSGIAGDLSKGFLKGVVLPALGIKAGVVNLKAGVVNGGGGPSIPGAGGAAGAAEGIAPEVAPMSAAAFFATAAGGGILFALGDRVTKGVEDAIISALPAAIQGTVATGASGSRTQAFGGVEGAMNFLTDPGGTVGKMTDAVNQLSTFVNSPHPDFLGDLGKLAFLQYPSAPPTFGVQGATRDGDKNLATSASVLKNLKAIGVDLGAIAKHRRDSLTPATRDRGSHDTLKTPKQIFKDLKLDHINLSAIAQHRLDGIQAGMDKTHAATRDMDKNLGGDIAQTRSQVAQGASTTSAAVSRGASTTASATLSGTSGTTGAVNVGASRTVAAINGAFSRIPAPIVILNVTANSITTKVTQQSRNGTVGGSRSGAGGSAHNKYG